jgi:predicted transposase YbfD/YdcC
MVEPALSLDLRAQFASLPDPRVPRARRHLLVDILFITLCAVLCGADDCVAIADYARAKKDWFAPLLELPGGIPSHDTFNRVLARLDPEALQALFLRWVEALHALTPAPSGDRRETVALDGKQVRHSFDSATGQKAISMVSAWASLARLVLGQIKVEDKSNEITAVPSLLALLDLAGCVVTTDAMSCQKATTAQIISQDADYVLALKDNHPHLYEDVQLFFEHAQKQGFAGLDCQTLTTRDKAHGRIEERHYWLLNLPEGLAWQEERREWAGLQSIGRVQAHRQTRNGAGEWVCRVEVRYFLCSLCARVAANGRQFARSVRSHWGIENRLHWVLDIAFREDDCRLRKDNAAQNMAVVRHVALNLLQRDRTSRIGVKNRRLRAAWDLDYLIRLLTI